MSSFDSLAFLAHSDIESATAIYWSECASTAKNVLWVLTQPLGIVPCPPPQLSQITTHNSQIWGKY